MGVHLLSIRIKVRSPDGETQFLQAAMLIQKKIIFIEFSILSIDKRIVEPDTVNNVTIILIATTSHGWEIHPQSL
jgi:hypothetical protein